VCDRQFDTPTGLNDHFTLSPRHPKCSKCNWFGFADDAALYEVCVVQVQSLLRLRSEQKKPQHDTTAHPALPPATLNRPLLSYVVRVWLNSANPARLNCASRSFIPKHRAPSPHFSRRQAESRASDGTTPRCTSSPHHGIICSAQYTQNKVVASLPPSNVPGALVSAEWNAVSMHTILGESLCVSLLENGASSDSSRPRRPRQRRRW
jgi:hypothetical protein